MPKKFLNKIIESAFGGSSTSEGNNTKKTDLKMVTDAINSVKSWDQLDTSKNLAINFIKKYKIRSESPEYKYIVRLYKLRKNVLTADRLDEGDDDVERLRSVIKNVLTESLEWSDNDENWDTDNSYWDNDPNWVQGDTGGGDSDSDSGDYDSFMGEDDELGWMDEISEFTLEWPWAIINDTNEGEEIIKFLFSIDYKWTSLDTTVKFTNKDAYANLNDRNRDKRVFGYYSLDDWGEWDTIEEDIKDYENDANLYYWSKIKPTTTIDESTDDLSWMDDIEPTPPREEGDLRPGDVIYIGNEDHPTYVLNILDVGPVKNILDKYGEELDDSLCRGKETMAIAYEIGYMMMDDSPIESRGDVEIMGAEYAKNLIVNRDYWKYLSKVG